MGLSPGKTVAFGLKSVVFLPSPDLFGKNIKNGMEIV
jgi:hypothetical protein